eukprot:3485307-Prymnesium_polylepis.1
MDAVVRQQPVVLALLEPDGGAVGVLVLHLRGALHVIDPLQHLRARRPLLPFAALRLDALCAGVKNLAVSSRAASGGREHRPSGPALSLHFKRVVGHERSRDGSLQVT